jgi:hypothetical protein
MDADAHYTFLEIPGASDFMDDPPPAGCLSPDEDHSTAAPAKLIVDPFFDRFVSTFLDFLPVVVFHGHVAIDDTHVPHL